MRFLRSVHVFEFLIRVGFSSKCCKCPDEGIQMDATSVDLQGGAASSESPETLELMVLVTLTTQ